MITNIVATVVIGIITNWGNIEPRTICYATYPPTYETTYERTGKVIEQTKLVFTVDGKLEEKITNEKILRFIYLKGTKSEEIYWSSTNVCENIDWSSTISGSNIILRPATNIAYLATYANINLSPSVSIFEKIKFIKNTNGMIDAIYDTNSLTASAQLILKEVKNILLHTDKTTDILEKE